MFAGCAARAITLCRALPVAAAVALAVPASAAAQAPASSGQDGAATASVTQAPAAAPAASAAQAPAATKVAGESSLTFAPPARRCPAGPVSAGTLARSRAALAARVARLAADRARLASAASAATAAAARRRVRRDRHAAAVARARLACQARRMREQERAAKKRDAVAARKRTAPATTTTTGPAPSSGLRVGLVGNTFGWGTQAAGRMDLEAQTGAGWLREEIQWSAVEPSDNQWSWTATDAKVAAAAQRHLHILPLLLNTPAWAGPTWNTIPADPAAYADYVAHITARYGPGGTFWAQNPSLDPAYALQYFEIWNEPYYPWFSDSQVDPGRYARLFKAAAIAGRQANPQARFLIASDTDIKPTAGPSAGTWVKWPAAMAAAVPDLGTYIDGIAAHPYAGSQAPDTPLGTTPHSKFLRIDLIRSYFQALGIDKPTWITEFGWSTCAANPSSCVTEATQATYLTKAFELIRARPWVQAAFLYHYNDLGTNPDPADKEARYGLTRPDGTHKPAYTAYQQAAAKA